MKRLYLYTTDKCNQRCVFCVRHENDKPVTPEPTSSELKTQIKKLSESGEKSLLIFDGGEPTLRNDFLDLLSYSVNNGIDDISVLTNATTLSDESLVRRIRKIGSNISFSVSLHSHIPEVSDKLTKSKGGFDATIKGISNLIKHDFQVSVYHIINSYNYRELNNFLEFLKERFPEIRFVTLSFLFPRGMVLENPHLIPKLTDAKPYVLRALNFLKENNYIFSFSTCGIIPLCILKGYENIIINQMDRDNKEAELYDPGGYKKYELGKEEWHKHTKVKSSKCMECDYEKICPGIWSIYADLYGLDELVPVKIKQEKIRKTVIMFGYGCNNRCVFCYNEGKRHLQERTTEELKTDILSSRSRGRTYLEIIGGEPTIRRDLPELIKFARDIGFETVMFATNGRMFYYKDYAKKILDAGITDLVFSIHGHTPELHDSLTGSPGSFKQLVKGLENLKSLGFSNIGSNTTIVKQNYRHLPEIGKFIYDRGIRNSEFIFVDPTHGAPKNNFSDIVPRISEVEDYVHKCLDIGKQNSVLHWDIRYFPVCYAEDYIGQLSELKEVRNFQTEHIAPDFVNPDVENARKRIGRQKPGKCRGCKYFEICEGIWKEYIKHYGDAELRPVKGKALKIEDVIR